MANSTLRDICFDATDQYASGRFWAAVLDYELHTGDEEGPDDPVALVPKDGGLRLWFNPVPEQKLVKNRVHIDINMPDAAEMDRLISLGATKIQEIRGDDGVLWWTIMTDPDGNEFCAFPPRG